MISKVSLEELKNILDKDVIIIRTSTKENTGIEDFEDAIKKIFFKVEIYYDDEIIITNLRHK